MDINKMMQEMMMNAMRGSGEQDRSNNKRGRSFNRRTAILVIVLLISIFFNVKQGRQLRNARSAIAMETITLHPYNHCLKIVTKSLTSEQIMKENPERIMQICENLKVQNKNK